MYGSLGRTRFPSRRGVRHDHDGARHNLTLGGAVFKFVVPKAGEATAVRLKGDEQEIVFKR